jgi:hypothetical protein
MTLQTVNLDGHGCMMKPKVSIKAPFGLDLKENEKRV